MTPASPVPVRCAAVALAAIRRRGEALEVLLLRRVGGTLDGEWSIVTGSIESGETAWQAAARELREETGLEARALYSAGFCDQFYNVAQNCIELVPVFVNLVEGHRDIVLDHEHSEYGWVTIDRAVTMIPLWGQCTALRHIERVFSGRAPPRWLRTPAIQG